MSAAFCNTLKSAFLLCFFSSSLPDCLFIYNGAQPSVILLSHQITSPFTAQGAGWLAAGLNECNDQALCGSHLLSSPFFQFFFSLKKKAPRVDNRRESYIVPANSLALIRSVLGEKRLKGFDSLKGKRRRGGGCIQGYNKWIMSANTEVRKPTNQKHSLWKCASLLFLL